MAWRGAIGSDDLNWIGLALINIYDYSNDYSFIDMESNWSGARGAVQVYNDVLQYVDN